MPPRRTASRKKSAAPDAAPEPAAPAAPEGKRARGKAARWGELVTMRALTDALEAGGDALWTKTNAAKEEMFGKIAQLLATAEHVLPEPEDASEADASPADAIELYAAVIAGVKTYLDQPDALAGTPPAGLAHAVQNFHDCLFRFEHDATRHLVPGMAAACEAWFVAGAPQHELVAPQTVSYLLLQALQDNSKAIDVKRVYGMRQALQLLDFGDASSQSLKNLILHAYIHPQFLTTAEGRKFLVYAMGLHTPLVDQIYVAMRNQIPGASKSTLEALGEILFKAWRGAEGALLTKLEYDCLQDLMNRAVHATTALFSGMSMAARLRKILDTFHSSKTQAGVDEMLFRLYEPILWRALKVANPTVRKNAATILIDAFPLRNPAAAQADVDEQMQRQFDTLADLLNDDSPVVRQTGVEGVCRVLAVFWELIPSVVIVDFLKKITEQLAFDVSDAGVRVAVVNGMAYIVNHAPLSHTSLKAPLQRLAPLMHDNSERVRVAMADLLLAVKAAPEIRFWDIVEIPRLLAQLAKDGPKVNRRLVKLLLNSFFPTNKPVPVQIERARVLVEKNAAAARTFYFYLPQVVSFDALLPAVQEMYATAYDAAAGATAAKENKPSKRNSAGGKAAAAAVSAAAPETDAALLELAVVALDSCAIVAKKDKKRDKTLAAVFDRRPLESVNAPGVWTTPGQMTQTLNLAIRTLRASPLGGPLPDASAARATGGRGRKAARTAADEPVVIDNVADTMNALDVLGRLLGSPESRDRIVGDKATVAALSQLLSASWKLLDAMIAQGRFNDSDLLAFLERALTLHAKFDLHLWAHRNLTATVEHDDADDNHEAAGADGGPSTRGAVQPPALVDMVLDKLQSANLHEKDVTVSRLLAPLLRLTVEYSVLGASSLAQTLRGVVAVAGLTSKLDAPGDLALLPSINKLIVQATQQTVLAPGTAEIVVLARELALQVGVLFAETVHFVLRATESDDAAALHTALQDASDDVQRFAAAKAATDKLLGDAMAGKAAAHLRPLKTWLGSYTTAAPRFGLALAAAQQ